MEMTEKFNSKGVSITRLKISLRLQGLSQWEVKMEIANYEVWIYACEKADLPCLGHMKSRCERGMTSASASQDEVSVKRRIFYLAACEHFMEVSNAH